MLPNHLITYRQVRLVVAVTTLDAGKLAFPAERIVAVIGTCRHVSFAVTTLADPEFWVDIFPSPEERAEQGDL